MPESELQALLSISQIDLNQDIDLILKEILAIVMQEIGGTAGTIMLVNEETGELEMVAAFGLGDDYIERVYRRGVPITCSPSGVVLKTGTYYEVPNIFDERRDKWWADLGRELGFSAQLFMPMKREDEVIGLLNIYMPEPHHYTRNEITFVSIAASHAVTIIEKAQLFQHVLEKRKELENEIKARQLVEETLEEKERLLDKIFALSPLGIGLVEFDPGGVKDRQLSWANKAMMALFGFKPGELEYFGQSSEVLYASREEFERVGALFREKLKKGELVEVDAKLKRRDGSTFDGYITICFLDPSKPRKGLIATISDITWRKQAEEQLRVSEEKFRTFMETASDLMHIIDKDGNFTYVNDSMAATLGYSKEELIGMHITQIISKEGLAKFESRWDTVVEKGKLAADTVWCKKDGKAIYGELKVVAIYDEDGTFVGCRTVFRDITERKQMEEKIRQSEALYRTIFEATSAPTVILDENGIFYRVNQEGAKISGFTKEELEGKKSWTEFIARQEDLEMLKEIHRLRRTDPNKVPRNYEFLLKDRYGTLRNIYATADMIPGTKRSVVSFADFTERKKAEDALRASEEQYRSLIETAGAGVVTINMEGEFTLVNDALCGMIGYSEEDLLGSFFVDYIHPDDRTKIQEIFLNALKGQRTSPLLDFRVIHKEGHTLWWHSNPTPLVCKDDIVGFTAVIHDITEKKRAEKELQKSEIYYRSLIENALDGVMIVGEGGLIQYQSPSVERILGYKCEEGVGKSIYAHVHPEDKLECTEVFSQLIHEKGLIKNLDLRVRHKDSSWRTISGTAKNLIDNPAVRGVVINYRDITEKKRAEEQIKASLAEKELLLQEIHHRVKNNMQVISSLLNLQSRRIKDKGALEMFKATQSRVKSMALIHEKLYESGDIININFADYIRSLISNLFQSYQVNPKYVHLTTAITVAALDITTAIPCGLIINELIANALKHAFPDGKGGQIHIAMHPLDGDVVELIVSDTGIGFPEALDFRNTESLGMQLVISLVEEQLGGSIELDRSAGTAFTIKFSKGTNEVV